MAKKILIALVAIIVGFLGYVSTRSGKFHYERSGIIKAPAVQIFPYLTNFKLGKEWNPYDQVDPNVKRTFGGEDGQVGSTMEFEGNKDAGSGKLEILSLVPNESVQIRLTMTKPIYADNLIEYKLTPESEGERTKFTWSMSGDGGFISKLMTVLIDCDKMMGDQFEKGIANLKSVVEK